VLTGLRETARGGWGFSSGEVYRGARRKRREETAQVDQEDKCSDFSFLLY
jgi:hypothetical protein